MYGVTTYLEYKNHFARQSKYMKKLVLTSAFVLFATVLFSISAVGAPAAAPAAKKLTCCEAAKAKKEKCAHKCCAAAAKDGKVCEKCNPPSKDGAKKS